MGSWFRTPSRPHRPGPHLGSLTEVLGIAVTTQMLLSYGRGIVEHHLLSWIQLISMTHTIHKGWCFTMIAVGMKMLTALSVICIMHNNNSSSLLANMCCGCPWSQDVPDAPCRFLWMAFWECALCGGPWPNIPGISLFHHRLSIH